MDNNKKKILVIIPAYNEEENILDVARNLEKYDEYDYVIINDGSKDNTLKILEENNLNHINLVYNLGIGGAMQTGYKYAQQEGYDIAIQLDGDGQHDPEYIAKIIAPVVSGDADMCIGSRYLDDDTSEFKSTFMRRLGKNIISWMIKILYNVTITDPTSGFRAANADIIEEFSKKYPVEYPEPDTNAEMIGLGYNVVEKPVKMYERQGGKTSINVMGSISYMIKVPLAILIKKQIRTRRKKKKEKEIARQKGKEQKQENSKEK